VPKKTEERKKKPKFPNKITSGLNEPTNGKTLWLIETRITRIERIYTDKLLLIGLRSKKLLPQIAQIRVFNLLQPLLFGTVQFDLIYFRYNE
jgi:hypothetical protein